MKKLIAVALLSFSLHAETVYFSANGKTFHASERCMSLARTKDVLHAERAEAVKHDLRACGICYRKPSGKKQAKNTWAVSK